MLSEADQDCALPSCEAEAACTAGPLSLSEGKAQSDMDTRHTPCSESVFFFFWCGKNRDILAFLPEFSVKDGLRLSTFLP